MNKRKRFYSNTLLLYVMTIAKYIFPIITFPYLTRVLEPDMYGIVTYMTATVSYFQIFVDFGFNFSATKDIAENKKDKKYLEEILSSVIQAKILLVVCSLIIFSIMIYFIPILKENILLAYLFIGNVILSIWLPDFLFRGIEQMEIITIRFLVSKAISTILTFILVKSKSDILFIPILNIIGSLVAICLTWYEIRKKLDIQFCFYKINLAINQIKKSMVYFISTFATTAFGATNAFMLGIMKLPSTQIAYWGVCYTLISVAQSLYEPITSSLYPHMIAKKDFRLAKKIIVILLPLIIIVTFIVSLFSKTIIELVSGTNYIDSVPIFKALLPILIFSFPAQIIGFPVLGVIGKIKETTTTTVISGIFHVVGLILLALVGEFNVLNVAILRSLTEAVLFTTRSILLIRIKKHIKIKKV